MATHTLIPFLGKRIRLTVLDECGNPGAPSSEDGFISTDGFIRVALSAETEDGTEIIAKKADGSLCVNEKLDNSFKRFNVEIQFCGVNPAAASIVSNAEPYKDGDDIIGFTVPEGEINKRFALELWTGLSGLACTEGQTEEASGYLLLPFIKAGIVGDFEVTGEATVDFTMTGASTKGGNSWGVGPYNVAKTAGGTEAPLPTALDPFDHLLLMDTGLAPPPHSDDFQAMPASP